MNERQPISVGVDPGFGGFKVAMIRDNERGEMRLYTRHLASMVGLGTTDLGYLSLTRGRQRRRSSRLPTRVSWDGVAFLVGENILQYVNQPIERMDFSRLSDGYEIRALLYASLGQLLGAGRHLVNLMVGLPVEVMADRDMALSTRRELRRWLTGEEHIFTVDDLEIEMEVERVDVLAQPAGTYYAWGMDDAGNLTRRDEDYEDPVGICDIGFNTLDLFSVQDGEVVAKFTSGDTMGMRRAAEHLVRMVRERYGVTLSLHGGDAMLLEREPYIATPDGRVDLTEAAATARGSAAGAIRSYVEARWGNGRQFRHLLFTGGGSEALRRELTTQYPHGLVLPDAVVANAVGLARYARLVYEG